MPNRYKNRLLPEVLYTRTLDWVVGLILLLSGVRVLVNGIEAQPALVESLPFILGTVYTVFLLIGGIAVLTGLLGLKHFWAAGFVRSGMWFACSAFGAYGLLLATQAFADPNPRTTLAMFTMIILSAGCAIRAHGLGIDSKANLAAVKSVRETKERTHE